MQCLQARLWPNDAHLAWLLRRQALQLHATMLRPLPIQVFLLHPACRPNWHWFWETQDLQQSLPHVPALCLPNIFLVQWFVPRLDWPVATGLVFGCTIAFAIATLALHNPAAHCRF